MGRCRVRAPLQVWATEPMVLRAMLCGHKGAHAHLRQGGRGRLLARLYDAPPGPPPSATGPPCWRQCRVKRPAAARAAV